VGTEKRERQKANRQQRLIEQQREERSAAVRRNVVRWGLAAVFGLGAVVLIAWIGGAFSGDDDEAGDTPALTVPPLTVPTDTTPAVTFPVPPKPEVELPAVEPTDLVITDLVVGEGPEAEAGDTVLVHYVGVLSSDGTEFDNSYDRGTPFPVTLGTGGVIQGWEEGLLGVQAGGQRQLDIPADLAYGDTGSGAIIGPGDAITFVVDVLEVQKANS
jgi:peptidylprolyl isomerase